MNTIKQVFETRRIAHYLEQGDLSVAELSKKTGIKRSTLNYYLNFLEKEGLIEKKRIEEKIRGRPTMVKLNKQKYKNEIKKSAEFLDQQEHQLLEHPLTLKLLNFLKENPNPSLEETKKKVGDNYGQGISSHLNWLISKGLIVNRFKITSEGDDFIEKYAN